MNKKPMKTTPQIATTRPSVNIDSKEAALAMVRGSLSDASVTENMARASALIPESLMQQLKIKVAQDKTTVAKVLRSAIDEYLKS